MNIIIHLLHFHRFFRSVLQFHLSLSSFFFFFNDTATTEIYTLSLHDALPTWSGGKLNATTILLEPLSEAECGQLISTLGGADGELQAKVIEAAQGNPLFVEEMLAMLHEEGDVAVPPTIHALLHARLDALGREERAVVERGSVEGQVFHRGTVLELAPETDVDAQLPL